MPDIVSVKPLRLVRDPAFAKRLEEACDKNPNIPPLHSGRLVWVREELKRKFDVSVSLETVRKWFWGEVTPRPDKSAMLASILEVDQAWLQIGIVADLAPRERRARNAMADGVVNVIAGLIQMDGAHPAFPDPDDARATRDNVDLYAIIKGANYAIHVSMGAIEGDGLRFPVPAKYENVVVLGVVREGFCVDVFELTSEVIETLGNRRGGSIELSLSAEQVRELHRIESFAQRL